MMLMYNIIIFSIKNRPRNLYANQFSRNNVIGSTYKYEILK